MQPPSDTTPSPPSSAPASPAITAPGIVKNQQPNPLRELIHDLFSVPVNFVREFKYRLHHLPQINYDIGRAMLAEGRGRDAVMRLRLSTWLAPQHQPAWYYLGAAYLSLGKRDKATAALAQAYKLNTNHEETRFMLAAIDPAILPEAKRPLTMPASIALDYFEQLAPEYDRLQSARNYRAPMAAETALRAFLEPNRINHRLLDLGCGTGLVGTLMAPFCEEIIGVDIARGMLSLASERRRENKSRVYSEAFQTDLRMFLPDVKEPFELITAVDVFGYVGDLGLVFEQVAQALTPGGLFLFQFEPYNGTGFGMLPRLNRFGHNEAYIQQKLDNAGLETVKAESIAAYYPDVNMRQFIVRKPV
jgi:predicted TPR repeat methyltransferase